MSEIDGEMLKQAILGVLFVDASPDVPKPGARVVVGDWVKRPDKPGMDQIWSVRRRSWGGA